MKAVPRLFKADLVQKPLKRMWSDAYLLVLHRGAASARTLSPSHLLQKLPSELAGARWNLAAWLFTRELLQKIHNYTFFFFFPRYHLKNILTNITHSIQNTEPTNRRKSSKTRGTSL